nr:transposase [Dietzia timorensis]
MAADPRHEELFLAWQIAHELRQAYHHKDLPAGRSAAEKILATLPSCPIPEIARLGRTLRKWKDSFLAYWTTDRSNNGEPKRSTASSNSTGAWPALPQPRQLPPADAPHRRRLRT